MMVTGVIGMYSLPFCKMTYGRNVLPDTRNRPPPNKRVQPTAPAVAFLTLAILMKVAHAADLIIDYLNGSALGESSGYSGDRREWFTALEQHSQDFPVMHSVFNSLETGDTSENGQIELEMILAGIEAVAKR